EMDRISVLVDELLLLARFESQKEAVKIEAVNINTVLIDIISRNSVAFEDKNMKLNIIVPNELFVNSDAYMLTIVLENLISNALKYSFEEGTIIVTGSGSTGKVLLEIEDFGVGIPTGDIGKVFNSFYRSRPEETTVTGSGLGLSITRRICELLNIEISIKSELNRGTKITLAFP
ncbi:MAG: two-component sensor histidine kinase, partial [Flavobacterium psychrophilum]